MAKCTPRLPRTAPTCDQHFAQHVLFSGELDAAWPVDGRALLTDPLAMESADGGQTSPVIITDGAGGAIVAWQDNRSSVTETDISASPPAESLAACYSSSMVPVGGTVDPRAAAYWRRYAAPIVRFLWRPRLTGIENLPPGPFVLVANHSGMGNAEIMSLIVCYLDQLGLSRPLAPMVHPLSLNAWPQGGWMKALGAIPSTYEAGQATLSHGVPLLVFPGGDHEAMRPVWQANRVDFAGRNGFLKIARGAGVPIVPLGIRGSHYTAPVIYRAGRVLPRLLVLPRLAGFSKRFPLALSSVIVASGLAALAIASLLPWWLALALAWLFAASPLASLPWIPWSIRMRVGEPISAAELFPDATDVTLARACERVQGAVQALVAPSPRGRAGGPGR